MSANRIALLRGINIGPRQRVSMPELRELIEGLGYTDVQTLVQSGNVVFTARAKPATLEKKLEQEIEKQLGVDPKVVVRTRDELAAAIEANPFTVPKDPKNLHVTFLSGTPDKDAVKKLEALDFPPDELKFAGREIYVLYATGWAARSSPSSSAARSSASRPPTATGTRSRSCWRWLTSVDEAGGDHAADRAEQMPLP